MHSSIFGFDRSRVSGLICNLGPVYGGELPAIWVKTGISARKVPETWNKRKLDKILRITKVCRLYLEEIISIDQHLKFWRIKKTVGLPINSTSYKHRVFTTRLAG